MPRAARTAGRGRHTEPAPNVKGRLTSPERQKRRAEAGDESTPKRPGMQVDMDDLLRLGTDRVTRSSQAFSPTSQAAVDALLGDELAASASPLSSAVVRAVCGGPSPKQNDGSPLPLKYIETLMVEAEECAESLWSALTAEGHEASADPEGSRCTSATVAVTPSPRADPSPTGDVHPATPTSCATAREDRDGARSARDGGRYIHRPVALCARAAAGATAYPMPSAKPGPRDAEVGTTTPELSRPRGSRTDEQRRAANERKRRARERKRLEAKAAGAEVDGREAGGAAATPTTTELPHSLAEAAKSAGGAKRKVFDSATAEALADRDKVCTALHGIDKAAKKPRVRAKRPPKAPKGAASAESSAVSRAPTAEPKDESTPEPTEAPKPKTRAGSKAVPEVNAKVSLTLAGAKTNGAAVNDDASLSMLCEGLPTGKGAEHSPSLVALLQSEWFAPESTKVRASRPPPSLPLTPYTRTRRTPPHPASTYVTHAAAVGTTHAPMRRCSLAQCIRRRTLRYAWSQSVSGYTTRTTWHKVAH